MFGRVPRYKTPNQFTSEMDRLYDTGYRGPLFIVDDNFIGNKKKVKELLAAIVDWQERHRRPFTLFTEASINLAQDEEIMDLMVQAGLDMVFIGIETPVTQTLTHTQKQQNVRADILESVKIIQSKGIEVMGGFIIGFDTDPENIFDLQINFIQEAGIPLAMIGTMIALPNTQLYRRLEREGRLIGTTDGNNTHSLEMNFVPRMPKERLLAGYQRVIETVYEPRRYFERCARLIQRMPAHMPPARVSALTLRSAARYSWAFILSLFRQTFSRYGIFYIRFLLGTLIRKPARLPLAVNLAIKGHHFFKMTEDIIHAARVARFMEHSIIKLERRFEQAFNDGVGIHPSAVRNVAQKAMNNIRRAYRKLNPDLKRHLRSAYRECKLKCDTIVYLWTRKAEYIEEMAPGDARM